MNSLLDGSVSFFEEGQYSWRVIMMRKNIRKEEFQS